ncbi:MAG: prepilin peptidase [Anaerolineae bacterium]
MITPIRTDPAIVCAVLLYLPPLVLIAVIDLEHRSVMIETLLATVLIVIAEQAINPRYPLWLILQGAEYAFIATVGIYLLGIVFGGLIQLISGRRIGRTIFGFGDVEIATLGGLILGTSLLIPALFIMIFSGGIGSLLFILLRKRRRGKYRRFSAIPYGPFICLGVAVALYLPNIAVIVTVLVFGYNPFGG